MAATGTLSHVDISVGDSGRSIPFYDALLTSLGYRRDHYDLPGWQAPNPQRATWSLRSEDGAFAIEVRPASGEQRERRYDR